MQTYFRWMTKIFLLAGALMLTARVYAAVDVPANLTPTAAPQAVAGPGSAGVHGKIMELGSPDALRGAMVIVLGTTRSAESDKQGFYRLQLEPGAQQLRFMAAGHSPVLKKISLSPGQDLKLNASLDRVDFAAAEYVVRGKKDKPQVITTTLSVAEIKKIPGTAGDALRAVQNLPGIAIPNDLSSQLVVQGGGPNDNLYLLDNIPWPFPFHFGGVLSTVNSDLLSSVDLNAAGFGVRWGDCLGAVLDAKTRAGKKDRLHASLDMNLVTSQLLLEGPVGIGDASFTLAGRRSYFDLFMKSLMKRYTNGGFTALPYFWDLGGSLDFSLDPSNHFRLLALGSDDILGITITEDQARDPNMVGEFRMENRAITSGASWINTAWPDLTSTLTPYYYQTKIDDAMGTGFDVNDQTDVFGLKEEAEWKAGEALGMKHEVGFGGSVEIVDYSTMAYFYKRTTNGVPADPTSTTVTAQNLNRSAYVQDRVQFNPDWAVTAGLHYDKNSIIAEDEVNPRVSLEWQYDSRTLWRAAWGLYDQYPGGLQTDPNFGNPQLSANLAEHTVISLEKKFSREFTGRVDAYYKHYYELVVNDPVAKTYINEGLGDAKGVELFLREDLGEKFFGWISYAYSKSERFGPPTNDWYTYAYDQPNILTLVASYSIKPAWSVGAKLHYNSGPLVKSLKSVTTVTVDGHDYYYPVFSDTYDRRLDDYLRLDIRTDYSWRYEGWRLNAYIEILNALNRSNPAGMTYSRDYSTASVVNNLPMMPYFGIEAQF
jgi:hypothetical protein